MTGTEQEIKAQLESTHGEVLTTAEATAKYKFKGFGAPIVSVQRKSDGVNGSLEFTHRPRFYFDFIAN
jgi:hypothetical protein|tara:strand:+ start:4613 stop:4816 length:204 start_codon:yes stop_codon:yes gene_type:complete